MIASPAARRRLHLLMWPALLVGVLASAACGVGAFLGNAHDFFAAYLYVYLFLLEIAGGCLVWQMVHNLTGGRWGALTRQVAEAGSLTLPLLVLLLIPLLFGLPTLYPWARPNAVAHYAVLSHRLWYLNQPFFICRAVGYIVVFSVMAGLLASWSHRIGDDPWAPAARRTRALSALGLVVYVFFVFHIAVDFIESRDLHMASTIFGMIVAAGHGLSGMAFIILALAFLSPLPELRQCADPGRKKDLGNLLLPLVLFWAYLSFMQFLIIWMGNTRGPIEWYLQRGLGPSNTGVWTWLTAALITTRFFIPFSLLLFAALKTRWAGLATAAAIVLLAGLLENYWFIAPSGVSAVSEFHFTWFDGVMPVALGGLWLAGVAFVLARRPVTSPLAAAWERRLAHAD